MLRFCCKLLLPPELTERSTTNPLVLDSSVERCPMGGVIDRGINCDLLFRCGFFCLGSYMHSGTPVNSYLNSSLANSLLFSQASRSLAITVPVNFIRGDTTDTTLLLRGSFREFFEIEVFTTSAEPLMNLVSTNLLYCSRPIVNSFVASSTITSGYSWTGKFIF